MPTSTRSSSDSLAHGRLAGVGQGSRGSSSRPPLPQAIAACIGFGAFAVSIAVGVLAGNPVEAILTRALVSMVVAFVGGFAVGLVCDWMVGQETRRIEQDMRAELAERNASEVGLDGLTGVDVIEDDAETLASQSNQSERLNADERRGEKLAA